MNQDIKTVVLKINMHRYNHDNCATFEEFPYK